MGLTHYLKNVASVVMAPVVKALNNTFPNYATGVSMLMGNTFRLMGLSNKSAYSNKIFYAGANIFVRKITEAPIMFSQVKNKPAARKFNKFYSKAISNENRAFIKSQTLTELEDHPLNELFDNLGMEGMADFWYNYQFGDGFLYFEGLDAELSRNVLPVTVHSLDRDRITIVKDDASKFSPAAYYLYTCDNGQQITIEKDRILHLKHWNPNLADLKGLGVDEIAIGDISLNQANITAQGAAFENGGRGTLFGSKVDVTSEGKRVGKMTVTEMADLQRTIQNDMSGARNNRRMKFTNAEVTVTPYGDTLAEMELVKSEENNWKNIFAVMGIPWALTPVASQSSENSIITGYKSLVTNLIISELRKFDQKLNAIIKQWWPDIIACHDLTEFTELAPDLALMASVFGKPDLSVDEKRAIYSYDAVGGDIGKAILVASGLMLIEDVVSGEIETDPNAEGL